MRRSPILISAGLVAVGLMTVPALAAPAPAGPVASDPLRDEAREYERRGEWDKACEIYARLLAVDRRQSEIRDHLQYCVRRLHQIRRHQDPLFRDKVLSLPTAQAILLYGDVLTKLQNFYADRDKVPIQRLFQHGLDELLNALREPVFQQEYLATADPLAVAAVRDHLTYEWLGRQVADANEAKAAVHDLARDVQRAIGLPAKVLILEFACGACNALDEYTFFITPGQPTDDPATLSGELAAYGLLLNWRDRNLVVERVVQGSWAAAAGIQPGDRVTQLGKQPLERLTPEAVADLLRGESAAISEVTVVPADGRHSDARLMSLPGYAPSVPDAQIERDGIGYLRIANFQRNTPQELESAVLRLRVEGMKALVLDLRGNPGGVFAAAVQVAERFLPQGTIVSTQGQAKGTSKIYTVQHPFVSLEMPLVVLIDGDTASAAEVVAGALKDNNRATLVGTQTYGKGSIQCLLTLQAGSGLRLTLARFFSPRGQPFTGAGVTPTYVEPRREPLRDWQLELALEHAARLLEK
ncbi:MAG TPA: S41 family peptidase [Gemmataceae bacterium]|nr:S41 family peptidase [Gemmataceae bacterium]